MVVNCRQKSFKDKKSNKEINYNEFYVVLDVEIEEKEKFDLVLKFEEKFAKEMLFQNLGSASFEIEKNVKNGVVYYNPVVNFVVGQSAFKIPVQLSPEGVLLARLAQA